MPLYFLVHDGDFFHERIVPALAESWRRHSFVPARSLCADLLPAARTFAGRYHLAADETLLARLASEDVPYDRALWRHLIGEVLLFGAADVPEFQTAPAALGCLLAPGQDHAADVPRARMAPIRQAHFGSRDLAFGGGYYRPDQAGWNDRDDVVRLADYLSGQRPETWTAAGLRALPGLESDEDRAEELQYARDWFPALAALYEAARAAGRVVVCENL